MRRIIPECLCSQMTTLDIMGMSPSEFQHIIAMLLQQTGNGTVRQTGDSHDGGKDIIFTFEAESVNLFGIRFNKDAESQNTVICFECKSTKAAEENIGLFAPAGSLSRCAKYGAKYFVLVTNSTISAQDYYDLNQQAARAGKIFALVDANVLVSAIRGSNFSSKFNIIGTGVKEPYTVYQMSSSGNDSHVKELYLLAQNPSESSVLFSFTISPDQVFSNSVPSDRFILKPGESRSIRYSLTGANTALVEPRLSIKVDAQRFSVKLNTFDWVEFFKPDFVGKEHWRIRDTIRSFIQEGTSGTRLFCLWGEAGVGKTRVLEEALQENRMPDMVPVVKCTKNVKKLCRNLAKSLKKVMVLEESDPESYEGLRPLLERCKSFKGQVVIVLDDLHEASDYLLRELGAIENLLEEKDARILAIGRNDYSGGSAQYYQFQALHCERQTFGETSVILKEFDEEDADAFVSIVMGHDGKALSPLVEKLGPRTIPLFVVSLARMLVDQGIARIRDSRSIEIIEASNLGNATAFIKELEDVYRARIKSFVDSSGDAGLEALFSACLYGKEFPSDLFSILETEDDIIGQINRRGFAKPISGSSEERLEFFHESFFTFLRRQMTAGRNKPRAIKAARAVMAQEALLLELSVLDKGRLACWAGDKAKAAGFFSDAINELSTNANDSSYDMNARYSDYWKEIFESTRDSSKKGRVARSLVYASLHHRNPMAAISISRELERGLQNPKKAADSADIFALRNLRAHAHINIGQIQTAESLLLDLYVRKDGESITIDDKTLFDMADRLSAICIRKGLFNAALALNAESLDYASDDPGRIGLSYMTKAKCLMFEERSDAKELVRKAEAILPESTASRLLLHNSLMQSALEILDLDSAQANDADGLLLSLDEDIAVAKEQSYINSVVRGYSLRSALHLLRGDDGLALEDAYRTIRESVRFGTGTYLWQAYNQLFVISQRGKVGTRADDGLKYIDIVHGLLRKQGLTDYDLDHLCYGNVLALSLIIVKGFALLFSSNLRAIIHVVGTVRWLVFCPTPEGCL